MKIRLSHTAMEQFLECERKFQLNRLLESFQTQTASEHFAFGHAFEAGCVEYLLTQDKEKALWKTYISYHGNEGDEISIPVSPRKNEWVALNLVESSFPSLDELLSEWEIPAFQGRPAVQLSFRVDINETFYFVGYLDIALQNRFTGKYAVLDFKTTGLNLTSLDSIYMNSAQLIGYSIILDFVAGKDNVEYDVYYFVGQLGAGNGYQPKIHSLCYPKSLKDRLNFFITLGMDVERLSRMLEYGIFPQRGASCNKFNRPCSHLGTCGLHSLDRMKEEEPDLIEYQFTMNLDEIIRDHIERS